MDSGVSVQVLIGQVEKVALPRLVQDLLEYRRLVCALRKVLVAISDCHFVPLADADIVGIGQVKVAVIVNCDQWVRIIEHRDPPHSARIVVVSKPECVTDLVRRELSDTRQCHLGQHRRHLITALVRREQPLGDQKVLPYSERAQGHNALHDLPGSRVGDRAAAAPTARRSMYPVNHVVANVKIVCSLGQ